MEEKDLVKQSQDPSITTGGRKFDGGKTRYDLFPPLSFREVSLVLTAGSKKYDDNNWRKVPDLNNRYFGAANRHIWEEWRLGQKKDKESNLHVLAHAICDLLFILELELEEGISNEVE
jgi:hypothetical protein